MDPVAWIQSLPPITRTWFGLSLVVNIATTLELIDGHDLLFDWHAIYYRLELWRVLTCFLYTGGPLNEFHSLILLYLITMHPAAYESNPHRAGGSSPRSDYVFCILFCITTTIGTYFLIEHYGPYFFFKTARRRILYPLFTRTLVTSMTYLWARRNPNVNVNLYFIPIQGRYLPFAYVGISAAMGNDVSEMLHGMLVDHVYYYLMEVVPTIRGGKRVLSTPAILDTSELFGPQQDFRPQQQQQQQQQQRRQPQAVPARARFEQEGATAAHIAAKLGQLERLRLLSNTPEGRASLGAKDNNGWQPLHEAVRRGDVEVVNFLLLEEFSDVVDKNARTQRNGNGPTPLNMAISIHGPGHPVT